MTEDEKFNQVLGPLFTAARTEDARLPEGLTARIIADAARVQDDWKRMAFTEAPTLRVPLWRQFMSVLGGTPVVGGLVAACAAGVWLGVAPPQGLDPLNYVLSSSNGLTLYSELQATLLADGGM